MDVAVKINPIPSDFGGNILKLAVAIKNSRRFADPRRIFRELSSMNLKGPTEQILEKAYIDYCDTALDDFCAIFWPCTFTNRRGRCVNVKDRHKKGHQNEKGQIIGTGEYQSNFTWDNFADDWESFLLQNLSSFKNTAQQKIAHNPTTSELVATTSLHHTNINAFYGRLGGAQKFVSHSTCFCCLREMAEHPLPCGHVLCTPCVKGFGQRHEGTSGLYFMAACPLHEGDTLFPTPWEVHFKPPLAGVRVLSLDGGGMRGIVILEVLLRIEKELGQKIPIMDFFDLIVGTRTYAVWHVLTPLLTAHDSTGGILALALGVKRWDVRDSIQRFKKLVDKAFTPKFVGGLKLGKSKYRTKPLEDALKETFKDEAIFGGTRDVASGARKVAVTASCETGEQAVIFANYNRATDDQASYRLDRPDDPSSGLKLWEAARATSAAPTFFKPFVNQRTKEGFIDGAVFHNNPVVIAKYESRLIWPDVEEQHPDIFLSIGTGHNGEDTEGFIDPCHLDQRRQKTRNVLLSRRSEPRPRGIPAFWAFPEVNSWINVLFKRVDNLLDSEATWKNFRKEITASSSHIQAQRYIRVNPRVGFRTPKMDDKNQIDQLHASVSEDMNKARMRTKIISISHRLVASCFYFEKAGPLREVDDNFVIPGTIRCRFARGSDNLRNLGVYIMRHQRHPFQPYFKVQEARHGERTQYIYLIREIIRMMTETASFDVGSIVIPVSQQTALVAIDLHLIDEKKSSGIPISGFPRSLAEGEPLKRPKLTPMAQKRESLRRRRSVLLRRPDDNPDLSRNVSGSGSSSSSDPSAFAETPNDVNNWVRRRLRATRAPPKPVLPLDNQEVFELYGSPPAQGPADQDEDDEALTRALARSEREGFAGLRTMDPGQDEDDEMQRIILLSLLEK
ncbi:FabD/lysophospholipase-like protein [Lindgomyces ingoldianus]|uniref:FabD/lysophospholipase-like protein n=1 Tax=Lindgomyces ingoldianus TaxID=673940 RepID=A0ACB6Q806_9PLEO|nr:FabD/lysophospholipase-like protein [Lindgomyces ingoldianus]KAF2462522.1 FabD/lysophospholipase-like protein [Lindgomyces ingoldianus]